MKNDFIPILDILASLKRVNYTKLNTKLLLKNAHPIDSHSTPLRLEDWELTTVTVIQEGLESSLSRCRVTRHFDGSNEGFCMFCETWIEFAFLCDTWFSLCIFTWNILACVFVWTVFLTFYHAWKGRSIPYAWSCFQKRYREPSCFCLVHTRCKDFFKNDLLSQWIILLKYVAGNMTHFLYIPCLKIFLLCYPNTYVKVILSSTFKLFLMWYKIWQCSWKMIYMFLKYKI